ncbi:MAG TPA: DUF1365 domain-containing protein [Pedococcus sp.]|uniref:DUF1365 domain-containing protein n=1 Tax=Pedococcus sp. TaxID=2860345 RepID=UPI002F944658
MTHAAPGTVTAPAPGDGPSLALPELPSLVVGEVRHHRPGPAVRHGFGHRVYQWLVDLDALPSPPWYLRPFATFRASDHLGDPARSLRENVDHYLALHGIRLGEGGRVLMLANARVLGHVFDPLTVFWCLREDGRLECVVAEVHNTYAERHVYLLHPDAQGRTRVDKQFYVSPFNDVSGRYEMRFTLTPQRVAAVITLLRDGAPAFTASFAGVPQPATRAATLRQVLTNPLMPQRVSALIRAHGIWLWVRRLPVVRRPHHAPQEGV